MLALLGMLSSQAASAEVSKFSTSELASACDAFLTNGTSGSDAAFACLVYFDGWVSAFTLAAGATVDGTPVYQICPPEKYKIVDVIKIFAIVVRKYPKQFDQAFFNEPMYAVPYTLKQAWPCAK